MSEDEDKSVLGVMDEGFDMFRMMGLWPKRGHTLKDFSEMFGVAFVVGIGPLGFICCWLYLGYTITNDRNYRFNDFMVAVTSGTALFFMYLFVLSLLRNRDKILSTIEILIDYSTFGKPEGFDSLNATLNKFLKFSGVYGFLGTSSYGVFSFVYRKECNRIATKYDMYNWCSFVLPVWLPFDLENMLFKNIVYGLQFTSTAYDCMGAMFVIALQSCIVELLIFKIKHLKKLIDESHKVGKDKKKEYFCMLIKYHMEIITTTRKISDAFNEVNMGMIICGSLVIGMIGFQCLFQLDIKNIMHASGWLLAFSYQCFSGQRLINASESLPIHFYSTPWYEDDGKLQKDVIFAIMRANYHLEIKAFNYGVLSMVTFSNAMQSAYSLLAMLSQTYEFTEENYD